MGVLSKKVFQDCLTELVDNVKPEDGLLDCLYTKGLVTVRNRQNVLSSSTPYKQMAELIDILSSKDDDVLDVVISFLQNEPTMSNITQIMLDSKKKHEQGIGGGANSTTGNDFSLSPKSVPTITRVLLQFPKVLDAWNGVCDTFVHTALDAYQIKKAVKQDDMYTAIKLTLDTWLSVEGKAAATFETLLALLREHQLTDATEKLEASREEIKKWKM